MALFLGIAFICVAMVGYILGRWDAAQCSFAAFFNEHGLLFRLGTTIILILLLSIVASNIAIQEPQIAYSEIARFIVGGLVAIGIYYSILTFEFNVKKNKEDRRIQKSSATFTIPSAWYNTPIVDYSKSISLFERGANYQNLKHRMDIFLTWFDSNEEAAVELRRAIGGMFNYFEKLPRVSGKKLSTSSSLEDITGMSSRSIITIGSHSSIREGKRALPCMQNSLI